MADATIPPTTHNSQSSPNFVGVSKSQQATTPLPKIRRHRWLDFGNNLKKLLFSGWHKFVSITIILLVIIGLVLLLLWIFLWNGAAEDSDVVQQSVSDTIVSVGDEANNILNSDSDNAYVQALEYLDEQISSANSPELEFELKLYKATFLANNGDPITAVNNLLAINEESLTDRQKGELYLLMAFSYRELGDPASAATYDEKYNALPYEAKGMGGGA